MYKMLLPLVHCELEDSASIHTFTELISPGEDPMVYNVRDNYLFKFKKENYKRVGSQLLVAAIASLIASYSSSTAENNQLYTAIIIATISNCNSYSQLQDLAVIACYSQQCQSRDDFTQNFLLKIRLHKWHNQLQFH